MSNELRLGAVMKSIDVYGRLAFGGQCIALMAIIAGPATFITASIVPFFVDSRAEAIALWLGGWAVGIAVLAAGIAFGVFCWRWSGDWITEWPGYAVGFGIAILANGALAYMITSSPIPVYVSVALAAGAAFAVGFVVAGNLAGTQVLEETRQIRQPLGRRR
jgi:hypothetical protein